MTRTRESIICLSHLRWNFVYQRPQHLLSRCAKEHNVVFFEEPMLDATAPTLELRKDGDVTIAVPHLAPGTPHDVIEASQRTMIDRVLYELDNPRPVLWYYTPMSLAFTHHVKARAVVYDCMDELSLFHGAPPALTEREALLLKHADVVFTGGHNLYAHKKTTTQHRNIHAFPSSVDVPHFAQAREPLADPVDQAEIPHPRIGFFGVIDERLDIELLDAVAVARPDLHFVMVGPVVKIDPARLPDRPNIYWLGGKTYQELPSYLAGWDVAMLPFARNESTRFISPTKTPEYLAAGKPVVSTSITDVVRPYGDQGLAWIADSAVDFIDAIDQALASERNARVAQADSFLADLSWDRTWREMWAHVERSIQTRAALRSSGMQPVQPVRAAAGGSVAQQRSGKAGA
ncbi:MAG: glycosyltransferase family 1 protein [Myxococcota bacterium]|nr:glycosyltransferase family 1 protein [Myxococcota bacterium]